MKFEFQKGDEKVGGELQRENGHFVAKILEKVLHGQVIDWNLPFFTLKTSKGLSKGALFREKDFIDVHLPEGNYRLRYANLKTKSSRASHATGELISPMPGKILQILVKEGSKVKQGDLLMILEAMKMEHRIVSPQDGVVKKIFFKEGDRVAQEVELVEIK